MKLISTFFSCFSVFLLCSCSTEEVVETDSLYPNIQYLISTDSKLIENIYQIDQRNIKNKEVVSIEMEVLVKKGYSKNVRDLKLIVKNSPNLLSSNSGGFLNPPFTSSNNVKAIYNVLLEGTESDAKRFIKDWEFKLKWEDEEGTHEIKLNNIEFKVKQP